MNSILKMALVAILINTISLNALELNKFNNISWDWIAIFILVLLFLLLLISLLKDIKSNKRKIQEHIISEKCDTKSKLNYINDINNSRTKSTNSMVYLLDNMDLDLDNSIKKHYKEILSSNKEEEIFLNVSNNSEIGKTDIFSLNDIFEYVEKFTNIKLSASKVKDYNIVSNKEIIKDILFLLSKLQTNEYGYKDAMINVNLHEHKNLLTVGIDRELPMNDSIDRLFKNSLKPFYSKEDKKYHGVYLYLIKMLADRVNAMVKINTQEDSYTVAVKVPIDIQHDIQTQVDVDSRLQFTKKALVITDSNSSAKLYNYLSSFNFDTDVESMKELNKEIPNFMDYDIVFMDSRLFEPILTDYLETIKNYSKLKIVALVDKKNSLYPAKLIDEVVDTNSIEDTISDKLNKLYNKEFVSVKKEINKPKEVVNSNKQKKSGKVLIADDDITNLHILSYMIKQYGIEVVTFNNGEDVLKALQKEKYNLVILDSVMPKLDGYETIKKIRENSNYNATPIVIHSSFSIQKSSMEKIFELGFDTYLPKPFNKDDLESLVDRYVPNSQEVVSSQATNIAPIKQSDLKEFIAIYGESDKMLDRYIKENRDAQAYALLKDLKTIAKKINANKFMESIDTIESSLMQKDGVDSSLIYSMSSSLKELKNDIMKRLSA